MNRMRDELRRDQHKSPEELELEIDATRAELRVALDDLQHSLAPGEMLDYMVDKVVGRVRRDGGEFMGNLGNNLKQHPLPALLTSVGILWLMAADGRPSSYGQSAGMSERMRGTGRKLRERWHDAQAAARHGRESAQEGLEHAREGLEHARETVSGTASAVRRSAGRLSSTARRQAGAARAGFDHMLHEQPLVLGLLGLAAGAIAGATLPTTRQEDEAFGGMRDRALERAKTAGAEGARRVRQQAEHLAEGAKRTMTGNGGGEQRPGDGSEAQQQESDQRHH